MINNSERFGLPTLEEIDAMKGIYKLNKKCPECGEQLYWFDGGDQGGVENEFCEDCGYESY